MKQHKKNKKLMIPVMSILVAVLFINSAVASISIDYEQKNNDVDEVTQEPDISISLQESPIQASSGLAPHTTTSDDSSLLAAVGNVGSYISLGDEDTMWGYNAFTGSGGMNEGPCYFPLDDPGDITFLKDTESPAFLSGGTYTNEETWIGCEYYTGALWLIDPENGDMESIGGGGIGLNGLSYSPPDSLLYGASGTGLYLIDMETGEQEFIGSFGATSLMIAIAFDFDGTLFGWSIQPDTLYTIDIETGECTEVGPLGINLNYAQDGAFDMHADILYLTGYTTGGGLYTCDKDTGECTLIGAFEGNAEIAGSMIPYLAHKPEHDIGVKKIIYPESGYATGDIPMQVLVKNYGNHTETTDVQMDIIKCEGQDEWLLDENFTGITNITFPPEGWKTDWWNISNTSEAGGEVPEASCNRSVQMAAGDNYDNYLLSPQINCSGWDKVNLRFALSVDIDRPNSCYLYLKYRKNSTSNWKDLTPWKNPIGEDFTEWFEIGCYGWGDDIGNEFQFNLSFLGYANYFNYWYLDDVTLETCAGCDEYSVIVEEVVIPVDEEVLVDFPAWTPTEWQNKTYENSYEEYPIYAYTLLDDDKSRNNDKRKMIELYYPWMHDVSAVDIQGPESGPGQTFPLTGQIKNVGQYEECCFDTTVTIQEVSYDNPLQIWTEDFETASGYNAPVGWSKEDSYMYAWYWYNAQYYLSAPYGTGQMTRLYYYYAGGAELISPVINTERYREEMTGGAVSVRSVNMTNMTEEEMFNAEPETLRLDDHMATPFNAQTDPVTIEGNVTALNLGPGWPNTAYVEIGVRPDATKNSRNAGVYLIAFNVENAINETWIHLQDYTGNGNEDPDDVIKIDRNSDFSYEITLTPSGSIGGTATLEVWVDGELEGTSTLDYGYESTWQEKVPGDFNEDFSDAYLFYSIIADRRGVPFKTYRATVGDITTDSETPIGAMYFEMGNYVYWYSGKDTYLYVEIRPDPDTEWIDITPWENPITENIGPGWFDSDATAGIGPQTQLRFSFEGTYTDWRYWFFDNLKLVGFDAKEPEFTTTRCVDFMEPGETVDLNFADWTPEFLAEETTGTKQYALKMETNLIDPMDVNVRNNVVTKRITLDFFHDVAVQEITSPSIGKGDDEIIFSQVPIAPGQGHGPFSDAGSGGPYRCYENFWDLTDKIGGVHWWGICGYGAGAPQEGDTFEISFCADNNGIPDHNNHIADFTGALGTEITFVGTGTYYFNYELFYFTMELPDSVDLAEGWVSFYKTNINAQVFAMIDAVIGSGDNKAYQKPIGTLIYDLAFELLAGGPSIYLPLVIQDVNGVVENLGTFPELDLTCSAEIYEYITSCENGTLVYQDMISDIDLDEPLGGTESLIYADYDFAIEGIYELILNLADDNDDNPKNNVRSLLIGVDDTPPDSSHALNPEIPDGDNGWYVNDVEVTLTAEDPSIGCEQPGSGIREVKYKIGDGGWQTLPGEEGTFILDVTDDADDLLIQYYAIDYIGNTESTNSFTIDMDQTVPVISEARWDAFQDPPLSGHWYVTFTCDAEDATSKMDRAEFFINDGLHEIVKGIGPNYTFVIEWSEAFRLHTFWFYHYDVAGNMIADDIQGNNVTAYPQSQRSSNLQQYPTQRTHQ